MTTPTPPLTKLQKRYLSRFTCAWCDHRMDHDGCGAIYDRCSPEIRATRLADCLKAYRPRKTRGNG